MVLTDASRCADDVGPPTLSARTRLLVLAPHPDDETIGTGVLIQQVNEAGGEVRIIALTSGDNNPWPQRWLERRLHIGAPERERWGRRREQELTEALRQLHVPENALQRLGWPDMGLTEQLMAPEAGTVDTLAALLNDFQPTLVVFPALGDRHPDHGACHVMARLALARSSARPRVLAYLVHRATLGVENVENIEVSATSTQLAAKQSALEAYSSQLALSGRRIRRMGRRPELYAPVAAATPWLPWQPPAWLQPGLRLHAAGEGICSSWRWADAPLQHHPQHGYRLRLADRRQSSPLFVKLAWDLHALWIFDRWGWCEIQR